LRRIQGHRSRKLAYANGSPIDGFSLDWRQLPWLAAIVAGPLLAGGTTPESLALLGVLIGLSVSLTAKDCGVYVSGREMIVVALFVAWALWTVAPLPVGFVESVSSERARLEGRFASIWSESESAALTVSIGRTIERSYEICLALACFFLAKGAVCRRGGISMIVAPNHPASKRVCA